MIFSSKGGHGAPAPRISAARLRAAPVGPDAAPPPAGGHPSARFSAGSLGVKTGVTGSGGRTSGVATASCGRTSCSFRIAANCSSRVGGTRRSNSTTCRIGKRGAVPYPLRMRCCALSIILSPVFGTRCGEPFFLPQGNLSIRPAFLRARTLSSQRARAAVLAEFNRCARHALRCAQILRTLGLIALGADRQDGVHGGSGVGRRDRGPCR